jgi:hypothetical protein
VDEGRGRAGGEDVRALAQMELDVQRRLQVTHTYTHTHTHTHIAVWCAWRVLQVGYLGYLRDCGRLTTYLWAVTHLPKGGYLRT